MASAPAAVAIALIRLYQRTLARLMAPRCRFWPTCSQYTIESIQAHGFIRGVAAGTWRVMRCGPWTAGGIDPVRVHVRSENG